MSSEPLTTPPAQTWTLTRITGALKRLWVLIVGAALIGAGGAYALSTSTTPTYESTSTLAFSLSQGTTAADLANGSTYAQNQMLTFAQLATSSAVLQPVIDDLGLDLTVQSLKRSIVVTIPQNTLILKIRVSALSGEEAAELANAIADSLTTVVHSVSPKPTTGESPNIDASLVDTAVVPRYQASPNKTREAILGGVAGLIVGMLIALVMALLDPKVRNEDSLRRVTPVPVLGSVPRARTRRTSPLVGTAPPEFQEEFRRVAAALRHATGSQRSHRVLLTSATTGTGTSTLAVNLALTLSDLGASVLLVDANLREPAIASILDLDDSTGLTTLLRGARDGQGGPGDGGPDLTAVTRVPEGTHLEVICAGPLPTDPGAMLTSEHLHDLLRTSAARHDLVILDSPPVLDVADTSLLVPYTDSVLVVAERTRTTRSHLTDALSTLETSGAHVVGTLLNRAASRGRRRVTRINHTRAENRSS